MAHSPKIRLKSGATHSFALSVVAKIIDKQIRQAHLNLQRMVGVGGKWRTADKQSGTTHSFL